jgi:hypothetical protein
VDVKAIKRAGGVRLEDWTTWIDNVLSPPVSENLRNNPEIITVLKAFRELIAKVRYNNSKIEQATKEARDIFAEMEDFINDRW